jgi:glutamate-ammonia-ligase adenylyltransferase
MQPCVPGKASPAPHGGIAARGLHAVGDMNDDAWQRTLIERYGAHAASAAALAQALVRAHGDEPGLAARVASDLGSFLDACPDPAGLLAAWQGDALAVELLLRLGGISRYGFSVACRQVQDFAAIIAERQFRQVWGRRVLERALLGELAAAGPASRRGALARFKHRHFLRLILGDFSGGLGFEALVIELSDVVDVLAQAAVGLAEEHVLPRFAAIAALPREQRGFVVLAMGKLGARELNFSSDIDLIFAYATLAEGAPDVHDYHQRLGQEVIRILENPDDAGAMFRVDMRLRPEGHKGELALGLRETIDYYYSVGRPWERQAMIKARPIAGDLVLGDRLLDELRPWVYPQEPEWETLDEARSMRRRIEERAQEANVKTGAGGIRDIEFLVQFFQLSFAGRITELRNRATLPTLRLLADRGIIPRHHAADLEAHYLWLRMVEHRLQMWEDRQEHELPRPPLLRRALAWRCGFSGPDALERFDRRHAQVRTRVREIVARHFLATTQEQDAMLALVVQGEADERLAGTYLRSTGLKDLRRACVNLRKLAEEPFFVLSRSRTERGLVAILPLLLHLFAQSPDPDQTLENFTRIVSAVGGRATFYELLAARSQILNLFADLAGWSNFLVTLLHDFPGLPDEMVDALNQRPRPSSVLVGEARSLIVGLANPAEPLAFMLARETAVVAMRDLEGLAQREVGNRLSAVAEAVTVALLGRLIAEQSRQWGVPLDKGRPVRFAVLGLGKLGSHELSYASDMDVLFVCDPGGRCPRADHDGEEFWTRVSQNLMRTMQEGRLYEIDPRLRPWGDQGPLVANTEALAGYWQQPRELWERMAMLRISLLAGDPRLGAEALALVRHAAFSLPIPDNAAWQVRDMRRRLEESVAGRDHVKRGWGGYVDHEFLAEYFSLGLDPGQMPVGAPIEAMLERLALLGRIPADAARELIASLHTLRFVEARMRLAAGKAVSSLPQEREVRTHLARRCDYPDLAAFDLALHLARETGRRWFDRLIPG